MLLKGKETHTSEGDEYISTTSLSCLAENPQNAFFVANDAISAKHDLKFLFKDNKIKNISYNYVGEFGSEAVASQKFSAMRAKYNMYMIKTPISQEALTPSFVVIEKSVNINLFFNESNFVAEMAPLVFLTPEDYVNINEMNIEEIKSMYEGLGFSCNIKQ